MCVESKKLACHLKGGVKSYPGLESKQKCEEKCDEEERCNFYIWQDDGWCLIYETCDEYRETGTIGSIYAKNSCPPQQGYLIFQLRNFDIYSIIISLIESMN